MKLQLQAYRLDSHNNAIEAFNDNALYNITQIKDLIESIWAMQNTATILGGSDIGVALVKRDADNTLVHYDVGLLNFCNKEEIDLELNNLHRDLFIEF